MYLTPFNEILYFSPALILPAEIGEIVTLSTSASKRDTGSVGWVAAAPNSLTVTTASLKAAGVVPSQAYAYTLIIASPKNPSVQFTSPVLGLIDPAPGVLTSHKYPFAGGTLPSL